MKDIGAKLTCAVTAFALMISFVAYLSLDDSLAWFSQNKEVEAQGMSVSVKGIDYTVTLESYGVTDISDSGEYSYDTNKGQWFELPTYDVQGISYSEYRKALIVVITVQSSFEKEKTLNVKLVTTGDREFDWASPNVFSNCMQITPAESIENGKVTKNANPQSFLILPQEQDQPATPEKASELNLATIIGPEGETETKVYFIIEYNSYFLTQIGSAGSGVVEYTSDIHFIVE